MAFTSSLARSVMPPQIFTQKQIFEKSWEYGKDFFAFVVDLEKADDRVPRVKLWKVLLEYDVDGQLLRVI